MRPQTCIEIHDAGLLWARQGDAAVDSIGSPGYAVLSGKHPRIGLEAWSQARLAPRQVHNRFWLELGTEPLGRPFSAQLSTADLAHAHLAQLVERHLTAGTAASGPENAGPGPAGSSPVVLLVPGHYDAAQLGLLVGIAQACSLDVYALVDSAVAAVAAVAAATRTSSDAGTEDGVALHLDLRLHDTIATVVDTRKGYRRRHVVTAESAGLEKLRDAWARQIATNFVRATRFDPLHKAETEQALYERLDPWLRELRDRESTFLTMSAGGKDYTVPVERGHLVAASLERYRLVLELISGLISEHRPTRLLLSHRANACPGLRSFLEQELGLPTAAVPAGAGCLALLERHFPAPGDPTAIPYLTEISLAAPASASSNSAPALDAPTHVLYGSRAYPLVAPSFQVGTPLPPGVPGVPVDGKSAVKARCTLRAAGGDWQVETLEGARLKRNGVSLRGGAVLEAGDRILIGSEELLLIEVEPSERELH